MLEQAAFIQQVANFVLTGFAESKSQTVPTPP
jgi:hypothetical protein